MNRVSVHIDNSNVFKNIKSIRNNVDMSWVQLYNPLKLAEKLSGNRELVDVKFYCVPPPVWLLSEGEDSKQRHAITSRYYSAVGKLRTINWMEMFPYPSVSLQQMNQLLAIVK